MDALITNPEIDALLRQGRVEEALQQPLKYPHQSRDGIRQFVNQRAGVHNIVAEDAIYAGLTLGTFLYDYIRLDPTVVRGVEFARSADVNGMLSFSHFAAAKADLAGVSLDGLHSELQGYVAEQLVSQHLMAQGHDVFFPHTPNNAGWDLMVDGHPFQVKNLAGHAGVLEHLRRYPDIPVIVNSELAEQVGNHAGVYVDPLLHHDAVVRVTEETLDKGNALSDFGIPWIPLLVSGGSNLIYMFRNDTDGRAWLTCTITDCAGRTILGKFGSCVGATAGLLLWGPAGAIVVGGAGAIGGASLGRRLVAKGRGILVADEAEAARAAARRVAEAAAAAMPDKLFAWNCKAQAMAESFSGSKSNQIKMSDAMQARISEQIRHWRSKQSELEEMATEKSEEPSLLCERALTMVRRAGIHAHKLQESLKELGTKMQEYLAECKRLHASP